MKTQLHIKRGFRIFNIRGYNDYCNGKPTVLLTCIIDDEDDEQDASFYLKLEDIDPIIEKLKEAKEFLQSEPKRPQL